MKLEEHKRPYEEEVMEAYCKENIDKYEVEPIVREAFYARVIKPKKAFIHLRVAQMQVGKELLGEKITGKQIAEEAGVSQRIIKDYKEDGLHGISPNVFIRLLIMTHRGDILDLWEKSNYNEELAEYANTYRKLVISKRKPGKLQRTEYERMNAEISKDACRKVYEELVNRKMVSLEDIKPKAAGPKDTKHKNEKTKVTKQEDEKQKVIVTIKVKNIRDMGGRIKVDILWDEEVKSYECSKKYFVHEIVDKIQKTIGGLLSGKESPEQVYLCRSENRKVCLAMEYIAIYNNKVFLLKEN